MEEEKQGQEEEIRNQESGAYGKKQEQARYGSKQKVKEKC